MSDIAVVIAGAGGRMGHQLLRAVSDAPGMAVIGALEAAGHPDLGLDAGTQAGLKPLGVLLSDDPLPLLAKAQALIDFTIPRVSVELSALSAQARIVHVIGTTGFSVQDDAKIRAAARHAVIVKSGNMSLGVNLLARLVAEAAKALPGYDIEIVEMHHRRKVDAPSGTALMLGEAAAQARGIALAENSERGRDGQTGARKDGVIGFASLRGGTVVGEHQVILAGPDERIVLSPHRGGSRHVRVRAVAAVRWGQGRKPGLYAMADVLAAD
ncbi:MAG: 4-hydroxy-tetrahydrodipicolinate reductase [Rhizomicrobium sp.]